MMHPAVIPPSPMSSEHGRPRVAEEHAQEEGGGEANNNNPTATTNNNNSHLLLNPLNLTIGTQVEIAPRTYPGINKPGGIGQISGLHHHPETGAVYMVDVSYPIGGTDKKVEMTYVKLYVELERGARRRRCRGVGNVGGGKENEGVDDDDDDDNGKGRGKKNRKKNKEMKETNKNKTCRPKEASVGGKRKRMALATIDANSTNKEVKKQKKDGGKSTSRGAVKKQSNVEKKVDNNPSGPNSGGSSESDGDEDWIFIKSGKIADYTPHLQPPTRISYWWDNSYGWLTGHITNGLVKKTSTTVIKWVVTVEFEEEEGDMHTLTFHPMDRRWKVWREDWERVLRNGGESEADLGSVGVSNSSNNSGGGGGSDEKKKKKEKNKKKKSTSCVKSIKSSSTDKVKEDKSSIASFNKEPMMAFAKAPSSGSDGSSSPSSSEEGKKLVHISNIFDKAKMTSSSKPSSSLWKSEERSSDSDNDKKMPHVPKTFTSKAKNPAFALDEGSDVSSNDQDQKVAHVPTKQKVTPASEVKKSLHSSSNRKDVKSKSTASSAASTLRVESSLKKKSSSYSSSSKDDAKPKSTSVPSTLQAESSTKKKKSATSTKKQPNQDSKPKSTSKTSSKLSTAPAAFAAAAVAPVATTTSSFANSSILSSDNNPFSVRKSADSLKYAESLKSRASQRTMTENLVRRERNKAEEFVDSIVGAVPKSQRGVGVEEDLNRQRPLGVSSPGGKSVNSESSEASLEVEDDNERKELFNTILSDIDLNDGMDVEKLMQKMNADARVTKGGQKPFSPLEMKSHVQRLEGESMIFLVADEGKMGMVYRI